MKKISLIALLVAATVANATPENGFYIGADVGTSISAHKAVYKNLAEKNSQKYEFNNADFIYDLKTGYKFNPYFATELTAGHLGKFDVTLTNSADDKYKYSFDHATVFAKGIVPINKNIDLYAKAGVSLIHTKYTENKGATNSEYSFTKKGKNTYSFPVAVGAEFAITDSLTTNIEYQYMHRVRHNLASKVDGVNEIGDKESYKERFNDFKPSVHSAKVGLTYYFGAKKEVPAPVVVVEEPKPITLSSEALFKFGSDKLSGNGIRIVKELAGQIQREQIENQSVVVSGHTDKIGSAQFNLKLSERRANAVAQLLAANDVRNVSAVGYGFDKPVTGEQCTGIKKRKDLIECYAPDRRVEIKITGQKR